MTNNFKDAGLSKTETKKALFLTELKGIKFTVKEN